MIDYPAAHSMDTKWFAIDKDGNIGVFDSGENGAVPDSSYRVEILDDLLLESATKYKNRVLQLNITAKNIANILALKDLEIGSNNNGIKIPSNYELLDKAILYSWLFLLSSDDVISRLEIETIEDNYAVHFPGEQPIVYLENCRLIIVKELIEEGLILAGKTIDNFGNEFHTLFGFFSYAMDYGKAYPYEQAGKPSIPLSLDDLPKDIRDAIVQTRFDDFSFNEKTKIQPIEHFPCHSWSLDQWWVDSEGNERKGHPYE